MPRTARSIRAGICYHVLNRSNGGGKVFLDALDYRIFMRLAFASAARFDVQVLALCLMPNHFHFVLRPPADDALAHWAHWLTTSHVHRQRRRYGHIGHLWQGRFKAFPVQDDRYLFTVMRYVERNALRAGLVTRAEDWPWCSLALRIGSCAESCGDLTPLGLPEDWTLRVNATETEGELAALRRSVSRGAPYGDAQWSREVAEQLGLAHALRGPGRPSKGSSPTV